MNKDRSSDANFPLTQESDDHFMASPRSRSLVAKSLSMSVLSNSTEDPTIKKPDRRHFLTGFGLKNKLDVFIYQNQPPVLVYLYCQTLIKDEPMLGCTKSEWLINLMKKSSGAMANTLIYIAVFLELSTRNLNEELCFREDSLSNFFSVSYAKTSDTLNVFVTNIVALIRKLPNWPAGYNIDADNKVEKVFQNFTDMIIAVSELVAKMPHDPVFATIMTLRYDMILSHYAYQPPVAKMHANSLFWLRLFAPVFRMQSFTAKEEPVIKRITALFVKASSNTSFNHSQENVLNTYFNSLIESHVQSVMSVCFDKITAEQTVIPIFKFKEQNWGTWDTLLISDALDIKSNI